MTWLMYAGLSALAAALTATLSKLGVEGMSSTLATAIRTLVVGLMAWTLVVASGEHRNLQTVSQRSLLFLVLSGVATAVSWLAYFRALQMAPASWVAPIDKLSLPLTVLLAVNLAPRAGELAPGHRRGPHDDRGGRDTCVVARAAPAGVGHHHWRARLGGLQLVSSGGSYVLMRRRS